MEPVSITAITLGSVAGVLIIAGVVYYYRKPIKSIWKKLFFGGGG